MLEWWEERLLILFQIKNVCMRKNFVDNLKKNDKKEHQAHLPIFKISKEIFLALNISVFEGES